MNAGLVRGVVGAVAVLWLGAQVGAQESVLDGIGTGEPIGVLPFANVSEQVDTAWIGAGIAEAVAADLAEHTDVILLERGDAGPTDACGAIRGGRPAGLRWVVDGGFQQLGGQLRITPRLVDCETGEVRSSARIDGPLEALFSLQDRIVPELGRGASSGGAPRRADANSTTVPGPDPTPARRRRRRWPQPPSPAIRPARRPCVPSASRKAST